MITHLKKMRAQRKLAWISIGWKKKLNLFTLLCISILANNLSAVTWSQKEIDQNNTELTATFNISDGDFVYKDYLDLTCDNPDITLSPITLSQKSVDEFDSRFKENKQHINQSFSLTCIAHHEAPITEPIHITLNYFQHSNKQIAQELYTVNPETSTQTAVDAAPATENTKQLECPPCPTPPAKPKSWSATISDLITQTDSLALRIFLVILLGILMSLTPCIYPMIPITVGILQSQATRSVTRNFMRAMAYTMGIATTFALLGLLAAFTGQVFGSIMVNPLFIGTIVILLMYLAGSMLGLYEMYIPSFMQPKNNGMHGSSMLAAFLFGAASGTVASPCLSPGLVLLLTLVTTLANKFMGFLLLFSFGIGLSIPLLLIGTFSSSLNILPKSGMWMVEVKRAFGLIMLLMCFYFLNNIVPWHILLWMISLFSFITGIFYLTTLKQTHSSSGRYIKNILSVSLIGGSVFIASQAFKATIMQKHAHESWWHYDYSQSITHAKHNKKLLFLDITAPYCSICKAIDSKLLNKKAVREKIHSIAVPVKIDISVTSEETNYLREKYALIGAPVFLLIEPENEEVLARWAGELYDLSVDEFVKLLSDTSEKTN